MNQSNSTTIHDLYELDDDDKNEKLCGFPLLKIPSLKLAVQMLPLTKVQFEYFLCDQPDPDFSEATYNDLLLLNPRVSPYQIMSDNYWNIFLTGVKPKEVEKYALWLGEGYQIPTKAQWFDIFTALSIPAENDLMDRVGRNSRVSERTKTILNKLDGINQLLMGTQSRRLSDQLFMRHGVMEWVSRPEPQTDWGGMGLPSPKFQSVTNRLDQNQAELPRNAADYRFKYYGFRLIKRLG